MEGKTQQQQQVKDAPTIAAQENAVLAVRAGAYAADDELNAIARAISRSMSWALVKANPELALFKAKRAVSLLFRIWKQANARNENARVLVGSKFEFDFESEKPFGSQYLAFVAGVTASGVKLLVLDETKKRVTFAVRPEELFFVRGVPRAQQAKTSASA